MTRENWWVAQSTMTAIHFNRWCVLDDPSSFRTGACMTPILIKPCTCQIGNGVCARHPWLSPFPPAGARHSFRFFGITFEW